MATSQLDEQSFVESTKLDVIFVVDGEEIPGQRALLSQICPYFEKLLNAHFKETNSKQVEIKETSPKVFKELLRFIHKGQLQVSDWTIEELLALMALAHRYAFPLLFPAVVKILEDRPMNFDSWTYFNEAASLSDWTSLKSRCSAFAEAKLDNFIEQKDLEQFSADLICSMLDSPKASTYNQDELLSVLLIWKNGLKNGQNSAKTLSTFQKISWEHVSPKVSAVILKEVFSKLKNPEEYIFWTEGITLQRLLKESLKWFARVDSLMLNQGAIKKFAMANNLGSLFCFLTSDSIQTWFKKNDSLVEIPVKRIEFESPT